MLQKTESKLRRSWKGSDKKYPCKKWRNFQDEITKGKGEICPWDNQTWERFWQWGTLCNPIATECSLWECPWRELKHRKCAGPGAQMLARLLRLWFKAAALSLPTHRAWKTVLAQRSHHHKKRYVKPQNPPSTPMGTLSAVSFHSILFTRRFPVWTGVSLDVGAVCRTIWRFEPEKLSFACFAHF